MIKFLLLLVSLCFVSFGLSAQPNKTVDNGLEIAFAKMALEVIKKGDQQRLKLLIHEDLLKIVKDEQFDLLIEKGQPLINNAPFPADSLIQQSNKVNFRNRKKMEIAQLSFPFILKDTTNQDSTVYFNISVSENKLVGITIHDYPYGRRIIEPKHSEPHLTVHSLEYNSINWFRIWYGSGYQKNEYGDDYRYYAVSGDKGKMDKLKIQSEMTRLFDLINQAEIDSTDFKYLSDENVGKPEYIYLRFKFSNPPYDQFGEFSLYHYLSEEPGKPESMSSYIILKHSNKTRYLLSVDKNPEIVDLLKKITYRKYDKYFERRWR